MNDDKRLFLLDSYALIYRAYYALIRAPRLTSYKFNTSAIFGFCNTLDEVLRKENPTHIAACFDPHGNTFRHDVYPEYKAGRDAQPEDISASIPFIKDILHARNIPVLEIPGYEADDVIGTLSRMAEAEGFTTYMMTPDKDYGQLVTDKVLMYRPSLRGEGFEIRGPEQIKAKYGIDSPIQVIDLLALEGDKSDNIPGCPGVGEKTAASLIHTWGSVENLLDHTDELKGALQRKIVDNAEQIRFSKFLATIKTDVPLDITPDQLVRKPTDTERLADIYRELEFRTFLTRLKAESKAPTATVAEAPREGDMGSLFDLPEAEASKPASQQSTNAVYDFISDHEAVASLITKALDKEAVGLALYLTGDEGAMNARLRGLAISTANGSASYIPMPASIEERTALAEALRPLFSNGKTTIVGHDIKTAMVVLRREGVAFEAPYFDTSVAHYVIDPEKKQSTALLALKYLNYSVSDLPIAGKGKKAQELAPESAASIYGEEADIALQLMPSLNADLESQGLSSLVKEIEFPFVRVLATMEYNGVRIDTAELDTLAVKFSARLHEMEQEAYRIAGTEFNIGSPMQVGEVLFERLRIDPKAKRTKSGAYSTTEEILEKYRSHHPIAGLVLEIRALRKLLTTYVLALPKMINPATGKIHTSFNQTATATGRISSTNPNLQNIPIRSDDGREIRRAFIPDKGNLMLSADYSQIELRLIADISGDESMIEAFHSGADIHRATAAKIYHLPLDEVSDAKRRNAKTANFGIIYGISAFGLSERLGIPRAEAKELIEGYFRSYPGVREYMDKSIEQARENGYVTTIKGRKRMLPDINSRNAVVRGYAERNAINAPIQGSAADIIKIAMIRIDEEMKLRALKSRMILQVHDELVFDVVPDELPQLQQLVTRCMVDAYHGHVALEVSSGVGANWLEAH